jgi:hypothetical protein
LRPGHLLLAAGLALSGCGTVRVATNDPEARIHVDGVVEGRGEAKVNRWGIPRSVEVVVKAPDGRTARAEMKRSFRWSTFFLGWITYGICWIACWGFPEELIVPLEARPAKATSGWEPAAGEPARDPWMEPPPGWEKPAPAPPRPGF